MNKWTVNASMSSHERRACQPHALLERWALGRSGSDQGWELTHFSRISHRSLGSCYVSLRASTQHCLKGNSWELDTQPLLLNLCEKWMGKGPQNSFGKAKEFSFKENKIKQVLSDSPLPRLSKRGWNSPVLRWIPSLPSLLPTPAGFCSLFLSFFPLEFIQCPCINLPSHIQDSWSTDTLWGFWKQNSWTVCLSQREEVEFVQSSVLHSETLERFSDWKGQFSIQFLPYWSAQRPLE